MAVVLGSLPELIIALVLVLILWGASVLFGGMLHSMASRIPVLGHAIESAVGSVISDAVSAAQVLAQSAISKAEGFILAPVYWVEHILADLMDAIDALRVLAAYIISVVIPGAISIAMTEVQVWVDGLLSELRAYLSLLYTSIQVQLSAVYTTITAVETNLESYTASLVASAEAYTASAISAESAYVAQLVASLEGEIATAVAGAEAYTTAAVDSAIAYTTAAVSGLEGTIAVDTSAITAWVTSQLTSLTAAIDAVQSVTLAAALTAAAAVEADLNNLKDECTNNLCSGLSDAARLINGLVEQGFIAALLGYAAWGASDPRGCGNATADVLTPIATGAKDAVTAGMAAL